MMFRRPLNLALLLILAFCLLPIQPVTAQAENIRFDHLTIEDGLSQSSVWAITQDGLGFIWFGTDEGLNRYDGYEFAIFRNDPDDLATVSSNVITALFTDSRGDIWVGTPVGLDRYFITEDRFEHFPFVEQGSSGLWGSTIQAIAEGPKGDLWIGTASGGLNRLDPFTGQIEHFLPVENGPKSISSEHVRGLVFDNHGDLWLATANGLNHYDQDSGYFTHYQYSRFNPESLSDSNCLSVYIDHQNTLWIGTDRGGLNRMITPTGRFERFVNDPDQFSSLSSNQILGIITDESGILWLATRQGINLFNPATGLSTLLQKDRSDPFSLSHDYITSLYRDRSGILWIGTIGGGVNRYARSANKFDVYTHRIGNLSGLSDTTVYAITETSDHILWIGTMSGGLNRLDLRNNRMRYYYHLATDPNSLSSNDIRVLYSDRRNRLWIGTYNAGLDRYNPLTNTFVNYILDPDHPEIAAQYSITAIYQDTRGTLWVGTRGYGFHSLGRLSQSFEHYSLPSLHEDAQVVRVITEDETGRLWLGTYHGLYIYDPLTGQYPAVYNHDPLDPASLSSDVIMDIHITGPDTAWVATLNGGLNRLDRRTGDFTAFTVADGLANNYVYNILPDDLGCLWLSTNRGLSQFNLNDHTFRNFEVSDGLPGNEFNAGAAYRSPAGDLYFGGVNGMVGYKPEKILDNPYPPPVVIRAFSRYNQVERTNLSGGEKLELSYRDNFISFEFAALDYAAPQKNQFAYKLEGFDKDWIFSGTRNYVSYTNLTGGDYTLRVKAANSDGVWNETGLSVDIQITPPFYTRTWFVAIVAIVLAGAIFGGYRFRLHAIETQNSYLEQQVGERTHEIERRRQAAEGLREIIAILNTNHSLQDSLDYIIHQAIRMLNARNATLFYFPEHEDSTLVAGNPAQDFNRRAWLVDTIMSGQTLLIEDPAAYANQHPQVSLHPFQNGGAVLGIPIASGSKIDGGLVLSFPKCGPIPEEEYKTALTLADQAALAIANATLRNQAEELAKSTERSRLARDLHDAVTQTLFASTLIADVLPRIWERDPGEGRRRLAELRQLTRGAMAEMRTLLFELRPGALLDASLSELIQQLCDAFIGRTRVNLNCSITELSPQPPAVQVAFYRIAQEAFNNIAKHAHANQVDICLSQEDGAIQLSIHDNGQGFDSTTHHPARFGLDIMHERAQSIGAHLEMKSALGFGTTITIRYQPDKTPSSPN